jgi:Arc/MetJ-type ribon-helix-helix transcriptional regulator
MTIDVTQETERIMQEELRSGHFSSVDDLIVQGVRAWREKGQREALQDLSGEESSGEERRRAVERIRELRQGVRMERGNVSLREFAHIGHRY